MYLSSRLAFIAIIVLILIIPLVLFKRVVETQNSNGHDVSKVQKKLHECAKKVRDMGSKKDQAMKNYVKRTEYEADQLASYLDNYGAPCTTQPPKKDPYEPKEQPCNESGDGYAAAP